MNKAYAIIITILISLHSTLLLGVDTIEKNDLVKLIDKSLSSEVSKIRKTDNYLKKYDSAGNVDGNEKINIILSRYSIPLKKIEKNLFTVDEVREIQDSFIWHLKTSTSLINLPLKDLIDWSNEDIERFSVNINAKRLNKEEGHQASIVYNNFLNTVNESLNCELVKIKVIIDDPEVKSVFLKWFDLLDVKNQMIYQEFEPDLTSRFINDLLKSINKWQSIKLDIYRKNWLYDPDLMRKVILVKFDKSSVTLLVNKYLYKDVDKDNVLRVFSPYEYFMKLYDRNIDKVLLK